MNGMRRPITSNAENEKSNSENETNINLRLINELNSIQWHCYCYIVVNYLNCQAILLMIKSMNDEGYAPLDGMYAFAHSFSDFQLI